MSLIWKQLRSLFYCYNVKIRYNLFTHYRYMVSKEVSVDAKYDLYRLDKGPSEKSTLNLEDAVVALKLMNYIRRMEHKAAELYREHLVKGFLHLYCGQEAVALGLKFAFHEQDTVITSYRCHALAVLVGFSARTVFEELMGRKTGMSKGRGGSMHMYGPQWYGGEGIVGGQVPVGAGLALAHKYLGTGGVSYTLYGDGAAPQGQVSETWNMAKLWNLPVVFLCENNKYAMGTAVHRHSANSELYTRGDLIPGIQVNGMKVIDVRNSLIFAREYALRNGPIIVEALTYRYYGHSMSDPGLTYRTREEVKTYQTEHDPIKMFNKLVVEKGLMTEKETKTIKTEIYKEVDEQLKQARATNNWPDSATVGDDLYAKPYEKVRGKVPWEMF